MGIQGQKMNERTQQLAEQARKHFPKTEMSGEFWVFDEGKFAQLIVMECTKILADNSEFRSCVIIGKHFKVEE